MSEEAAEVSEVSEGEVAEDVSTDEEGTVSDDTGDGIVGGEEGDEEQEPQEEKHKLKIDGEERELTVEEMKVLASKAGGADKMFREAAEMRKQVAAYMAEVERLKSDPFTTIEGAKDKAEKYLYDLYQRENMPEEQRALLEAQERVKALEDEKAGLTKSQQEAQLNAETEAYMQELDQQMHQAFSETSIPATKYTSARAAYYMEQALNQDINMTAAEAVALVKEDLDGERESSLSAMSGEQLFQYLGADGFKKAQDFFINGIKSPQDGNTVVPGAIPTKRRKAPAKKAWSEWKEQFLDKLQD